MSPDVDITLTSRARAASANGGREGRVELESGIQPLDRRLGGLTAGGLHLLAGVPGSGRLVALLQFLAQGLEDGGRVALVGAVRPERALEQARHWGFELEDAWQEDRLRFLTFTAGFERRLLSAAEPGEVFDELGELLGVGRHLQRLAIHPGTPLWETRSGTNLASQFVRWTESLEALTWATLASDLDDTLTPATEWVLQAAAGLFHLKRRPGGLHEIEVRRMSPPTAIGESITLEAVPGRGLVAPTGRLERRRSDRETEEGGRLAILRLSGSLPAHLQAWARGAHRENAVTEVGEALPLVKEIEAGAKYGLLLVFTDRERLEQTVRACRVLRRLTDTPMLVATEDRLRSGDRVRLLEAGAHDVLSAPLSLAELASRAERARAAGSGGRVGVGQSEARGAGPETVLGRSAGLLDAVSFGRAVRERLAHPDWRIFSLLRVQPRSDAADRLGAALVSEVRDEEADLVGSLGDGFGVLLQGAELRHAQAFLERLRGSIGQDVIVDVGTWSGLTDRDRIEAVLAEAGAGGPSRGHSAAPDDRGGGEDG